MDAISKAVKVLGTQQALAAAIGVSPQAVSQWVKRERPVPPKRCRPIQVATGNQVTAEELRPDVFGPPASRPHGAPPPRGTPSQQAL